MTRFLAALLLCLIASPVGAQVSLVSGAFVFEKGIYIADAGPVDPQTGVKAIRSARLLQATTDVPLRIGVRFGLRYVVKGRPIGATSLFEIVTRYPPQGIKRAAGPLQFEHRHSVRVGIGVPQYSDFQLDEPEELAPGIWTIEIWHAGNKLGEQRYCLFKTDPLRNGLQSGCRAESAN